MKNSIYLLVAVFTFSFLSVKAQFSSTPCSAGPLPVSCASNTVVLTSAFTNSGVINPSVENGVGCNSVGSNMTAGRIGNISGDNAYDGWFTTTADDLGVVDVYASIVTGDPVVGIYSGTCGALTLLTCDDDGGTGLDANATATGLTPGQTYWVRVWDYNGGTGTYSITSNDGTPPANDLCSAAESLTLNAVPISGTTYCATVSVGDYNDCENLTENNVWYSFTTTVQGEITVNFSSIDCFGSGQGIDVSVFYGDCSSAVSYGCTAVNAGNTGSISTFTGPAGTYFVMVDGNNSGGTTALCEFDVDVDFVGCTADAGTNTSPALITVCAGDTYNPTATGTTNTNVGSDPCIGWGFWVANDPLNQYPGMIGVGNLPTGNNPAGAGGDPNYVGVYTSATHPLANGETPTLPAEGNGVTYYIAPITLSNCATGGITTSCFDIGNVTQVYHNPQINTSYVIDCDDPGVPSTNVAIVASGGNPRVDGSSFTVTNLGDGTLDISGGTGNGVTFYVNDVPDGGSVSVLIEDDSGCSETLTLGPIDATAYCPICGAEAGNINAVQTGSGITTANSGVNGSPFVLCYGDDLTLTHLGDYVLPPDPNYCGSIPLPGSAGSCNPGIVYGIFTSLAATANPFDDAAFTNFGYVGQDRSFSNNGNLITNLIGAGIPVVNNTIWLYPVTADLTGIDTNGDGNLNWDSDSDNDGCVDSGFPFQITFLNSLAGTILYTCNGPEVTITGGYSEFFGGNYLITNNGGGTITGLPVTHNGSITITGLNDGDAYDFDITDNNGCSINIAGTFNYSEPVLSINNLASEFCLNDPADDFDVTPLPFTITTGSFDIDFVSDGFTSELTWSLVDNLGNPIATGGPYGGFPSGVSLPTVVVSGLDPAVGPFTLVLNDSFGDGQDGTSSGGGIGSTTVTNNITGQVVASTSGNWGTTTSLSLGNFFSTSVSIVGTGVVDNGDGTAVFTPSTVGTHTINFIYDNGEGCTYTESQIVTVHRNPLLSSVINPEICSDETILLSEHSPGEANGVAGTGTWYEGANSSGATAPVIAFTPADGDQFFYEYVATNGGCIDSKMITVTVNATPVLSITNPADVCSPATVDITDAAVTVGSTSPGTLTYWEDALATTPYATPTAATDGTYYIQADNAGCIDIEAVTVTVNATPVLSITNPADVCSPATVDITDVAVTVGSTNPGTLTYWEDALATIPYVTPTAATDGTYYIQADNAGCTDIEAVTVTVNFLPVFTIDSSTDPTICGTPNGTITLTGLTPNTNYNLSYTNIGDGLVNLTNISTDDIGVYVITNLAPDVYNNFTINDGNCDYVVINPIALSDPGAPSYNVVVDSHPSTCGGNDGAIFITGLLPNTSYELSYLFNNNSVPTQNVTTDPDGDYMIINLLAGEYTVFRISISGCAGTTVDGPFILVDPDAPDAPDVIVTAPTCSADGSAIIDEYNVGLNVGLTYTFDPIVPTEPTVDASGVISGFDFEVAYTVTAYDPITLCTSAASGFTVFAELITPDPGVLSGTQDVCVLGTTTFTSNGVLGGEWSSDDITIATVDASSGVVTGVSVGTTTIRYLVTSTESCSDEATRTVTVTASPNPGALSGVQAICEGATTNFTSNGDAGGEWITNDPDIATVDAASGIVTGVSAGTATISYVVTGTGGCPNETATRTVTVTAPVNAGTLSGVQEICLPGTTTFISNGVQNGAWGSDDINIATVDANGVVTGVSNGNTTITYTVSGTGGCPDASATPLSINVIEPPVIDVINPVSVCDSYTLPVISGSNFTFGQAYYSQTGGNGDVYNEGDVISSTITLYAYDINGTCSSEEELVITIDATPSITNPGSQVSCTSFDLSALAITGTALSSNVAYYNNSQMNSGTALTGTLTETQTVWIYDANGSCTDEVSFVVTVHANPSIRAFYGGDVYCEGEFVNDVMVEFEGTPDFTINYSVNGVATSITTSEEILSLGNAEGVYTLTELVDANCSADVNDEEIILINPIPDAPTAGNDATYCHYEVKLPLFAETSLNGELTWYSDEELSQQIGTGDSFTPFSTVGVTSYYVMETAEGCKGLATLINIVVEKCDIEIPTAFTPNGDGINDVWEIPNLSENFPDCVVRIFNRWGNLLFESTGYHNPWDGTYNGEPMPVASYYYIIDFNDGNNETASGSLTIVRRK